uniref:SPOC domain-containing protein n=1 Tax=Steinernema glaseri TaxID=37863 RepID=A0A1I7YYH5_9BILA
MSTHGGNFFMHAANHKEWSPFTSFNGRSGGSRTPSAIDTNSLLSMQPATNGGPDLNLYSQIFKPVPSTEVTTGIGKLTWLSSKAGLLTCNGLNGNKTVSFQLKDFCDAGVSDLTMVLRPGFTLAFQAIASEAGDLIATQVSPVMGAEAEIEFANATEVDLESPELSSACGPPRLAKDTYSVEQEMKAIPMLLSIFRLNPTPQAQLSSLHSQISNCGDEELFRYVGTSSLKRRQFLERRTHIFKIGQGDCVMLQPAAVFNAVNSLARFLLRRGGATTTDVLCDYFANCPDLDRDAYRQIGEGRNAFMNLITEHCWIFALFPGGHFVSVKRNLPHFEYATFLAKNFSDNEAGVIRSMFKPSPLSALPTSNSSGMMPTPLLGPAPNRLPTHPAALNGSNGGAPSNGGNVNNVANGSATRPIGPGRSNGMMNAKNGSQMNGAAWMAAPQSVFDFGTAPGHLSTGSSPMSPWSQTFPNNMSSMQNAFSNGALPSVTSAAAQTSSVWNGTSAAATNNAKSRSKCDAAVQTDYSTLTHEIACGPDESVHRCACGNVMPVGAWSPGSTSSVPSAPSSASSQLSPFAGGFSKSSQYSSSGRSSSGDVSEHSGEKGFTPFSQVLPFDLNFSAMKLS